MIILLWRQFCGSAVENLHEYEILNLKQEPNDNM